MSRKCPTCEKTVYMGEKKESLGNWYHPLCLKCKKCGRQLATGSHAEVDYSIRDHHMLHMESSFHLISCSSQQLDKRKGQPYCHNPCYASQFGPGGFGHGGTESHKY
ncbi:cysteine-rich protein 1-like isoform X1 [Orbicella faveolata]|uniref:cysteine-rich protein 1-like isoform X1 n=1 Tax=Orbicella faveolata TaxID=48498 RepID=UPI0009E1FAF3|nr:cysteine-rich protein 1-like isoform X1 [Orbicella faveolata]